MNEIEKQYSETSQLRKEYNKALREFKRVQLEYINAQEKFGDVCNIFLQKRQALRSILDQTPSEPTLKKKFERWKNFHKNAFFNHALTEVWIVNDVASETGFVWASPDLPHIWGKRWAIPHRKLVALCSIERWWKRNRERILAFLYRPEGRLAQMCIRRAMSVVEEPQT